METYRQKAQVALVYFTGVLSSSFHSSTDSYGVFTLSKLPYQEQMIRKEEEKKKRGASLVVQWLRFCSSSWVQYWVGEVPHAMQDSQKNTLINNNSPPKKSLCSHCHSEIIIKCQGKESLEPERADYKADHNCHTKYQENAWKV